MYYSITNDKGMQVLLEAVKAEWTIGKGNLPHSFSTLFQGTSKTLLKPSATKLKQWFTKIRK